jgi:hypothetical protein
LTDS